MDNHYDIIVVGAGHAGNEAAAAAANMGSKTLMITMNMNTIGQMSCNPAMGGIAKGQIVREIDALGGFSGIVSDKTAIQFRMLNQSKGPAMWSPRTQNDRVLFSLEWRYILESLPNLHFRQDSVNGLIVEKNRIVGVKTAQGNEYRAKAVILTSGTFLNGVIHIGERHYGGGRAGDPAATGITEDLVRLGFESGRMKTGTPPRVDGRSLDYSKMELQPGDEKRGRFSFKKVPLIDKQLPCHITYTSPEVHEILRTGFDRSPMFSGRISGTGPRYCPSIEDKIDRFADRDRHQLFVEPEGLNTVEIYVNGFSTSLPEEVQISALKMVPGFERARLFRPGYAIEYDYFPPTQLTSSLQTKLVEGLFFAGQINGTTGYEEAACQGLMAGINAHLHIKGEEPFVLDRSQAYIGVLIDDLISKGTKEPYRMFTSRAEFRILLRQDNADERLTPLADKLGLVDEERLRNLENKLSNIKSLRRFCDNTAVSPEEINETLLSNGTAPITQKVKLSSIMSRPQIDSATLLKSLPSLGDATATIEDGEAVLSMIETEIKYSGYIEKEREMARKMRDLEDLIIPFAFDFSVIGGLSSEAKEKLSTIKPGTVGQASRISGVSPADVSAIMVRLGR
jgi:tRNA uridine 5-carboxymethylaminomethyl modification enzyme